MTSLVSRVACMRLLGRSSAPPRNALSLGAALSSDLTLRITRRPAPRRNLTSLVSAVACMRLLDGVILSPPRATRSAWGTLRPAPCPPPPAPSEVRPRITAGAASSRRLRHPPRPRVRSAQGLHRNSNLTPRITRPPTTLKVHDIMRVAGRVHALVRPPTRSSLSTYATGCSFQAI
jgi:hypothetical protein